MHFTNNIEELGHYIPPTHVPKEMGGEHDWEYQYVEAVPGENDTMKNVQIRDQMLAERELIVKEFEQITTEWIARNAADTSEQKQKRHELADRLKDGYWRLDPYVRARSYYDRVGMITSSRPSQDLLARRPVKATETTPVHTPDDEVD